MFTTSMPCEFYFRSSEKNISSKTKLAFAMKLLN